MPAFGSAVLVVVSRIEGSFWAGLGWAEAELAVLSVGCRPLPPHAAGPGGFTVTPGLRRQP